jgi:superfamily II DNA/RNA helicase/very-short-patch-repair endonuclease
MDVFALRERLVRDYRRYAESFLSVRDERIAEHLAKKLDDGLLWPDPPLQLNPSFEPGGLIDDLVADGQLHPECSRIFRVGKSSANTEGAELRLHRHQTDAIQAAKTGKNYVLTTGTGSGKSMAYIVPIVDYVLRNSPGDRKIKAIVVYPMNALANSQENELAKFLEPGYPEGKSPVRFRRYTGQESEEEKEEIRKNPPDILLTNYVMLEYLLTRPRDKALVSAAQGLPFLVLDELHTYRGRQGADVGLLVRRLRERCRAENLQCVGTSATLAGPGSLTDQKKEVARVAGRIFGSVVEPENVINETLKAATQDVDLEDPDFRKNLAERITTGAAPDTYQASVGDPLACWIERTLGITWAEEDERYRRCQPVPLRGPGGAASMLAEHTGLSEDNCATALTDALLKGSATRNELGFPVFAFRLHQFFSGGNSLAASIEHPSDRHISTSGQQYVAGSGKEKVMMPLVFCRECGQDYMPVRRVSQEGGVLLEPRKLSDQLPSSERRDGYVCVPDGPLWPEDQEEQIGLLPNDWLEPDTGKIKKDLKDRLPQNVSVHSDGRVGGGPVEAVFIPAPFRFCLTCGVAYQARQRSDFGKLATLGAGGRSTGTTILGLSAVRDLRSDETLDLEARKLLSFSDNRQDASLQAGHFNDFVEISLLRSALYKACEGSGPAGLTHDEMPGAVFAALSLPARHYAAEPELKGGARKDTDAVFREVLEHRVYRDQQRGWRLTSPNLEQTGLLRINYDDISDCAADDEVWSGELPEWAGENRDPHPALQSAEAGTREEIARTLLDYLRRELAIKVDVLDLERQEGLKRRSSQRLVSPWAIDENETLTSSTVAYPRSRSKSDRQGCVYVSSRGGFGQFLGRSGTFPHLDEKLSLAERDRLIAGTLEALRRYGLVEVVDTDDDGYAGYQLPAAQLRWVAGDGKSVMRDRIRMPRPPKEGAAPNDFFLDLYRSEAKDSQGIEAREHTAQVRPEDREEREREFRSGELPVLFCSPTMELGVDISSLNVVNLRNVPPTPANYAQRSGRAGRSGQPALVYTFCSAMNSHDQYFFARPEQMVSGQVAPPQIDLANEDLVRAHVHAIWLAETGQSLGWSLTDVLDVDGPEPALKLKPSVEASINSNPAKQSARKKASEVLAAMKTDLADAPWWTEKWLERVVDDAPRKLDEACERWRDLYLAARRTIEVQTAVTMDASKSTPTKNEAKRLRREAEAQLELLTNEGKGSSSSDFYSYRYFASEGFLPGYSFPRLPLSAFIPGRKGARDRNEEFVQRPRFLAITEFGPRSIVYHEGARYSVNKVILPVNPDQEKEGLPTENAKVCSECGYLHQISGQIGPDLCNQCGAELDKPLTDLLRLQNVATRRRDRISSDEEERQRQGYEVRTSVQFTEHDGQSGKRSATVVDSDGADLLRLEFGQAATIWRINLGWSRRKEKDIHGFVLDTDRGYWAKDESATPDDPDDPLSASRQRVIPYVEDRRNCLLLTPAQPLEQAQMASLQAALKRAIQAEFQLEEQELAAEPLPTPDDRRVLLLFEAAEGGAGVLRRLIDDSGAIRRVAATALDLCHFSVEGEDRKRANHADEDCELACYDCLLSYGNQRDHRELDRNAILNFLLKLAGSTTNAEEPATKEEHGEKLKQQCDTELERKFIDRLMAEGRNLPDEAQTLIADAQTRPDFIYRDVQLAVFVDGPVHDYADKVKDDELVDSRLDDLGWEVVRFRHDEDWSNVLDSLTSVFGAKVS